MTLPRNVKALIDGYERRGESIPDRFRSPAIMIEAQPYLTAFWSLSHDRHLGFGGSGGIPFSAIDRYARRSGIIDPDEFWTLDAMIRACDAVWLRHANASGKDKQETISDRPVTPAMFDAMFG